LNSRSHEAARAPKKKEGKNEESSVGRYVGRDRIRGGLFLYGNVHEDEELLRKLCQVGAGMHQVPGGRLPV